MVVPKELVAASQAPIDDVREPLSGTRQSGVFPAIGNEEVEVVNGLENLNCGSPLVVSGAEPDMLAPSASSPVLASFVVEEKSPLPWAKSDLDPDGNIESSLQMSPNGLGELGQGDASVLQGVLDLDAATERPTSPRSLLFFPLVEATVLPASP